MKRIIMQLFQRIKQIAHEIAGSEAKLAAKIGLPQRKFNGYLNPISEKNLWQHLFLILEAYPEVNRAWLYFGEGEMLAGPGGSSPAAPTAPSLLSSALLSPSASRSAETAEAPPTAITTAPASEREVALEKENALLRELLASKDKIIALHECANLNK